VIEAPKGMILKDTMSSSMQDIGGTRMVVGAGLPDEVREKTSSKNRPMMFVNGNDKDGISGSVPYA
jgi:hypothetical protein